jgi:hypothetical protein
MAMLCLSSTTYAATDCASGGCNNSSALGQSQSQSDYNSISQSPQIAMSGSNSNSIINSNVTTSTATSLSADGGFSTSGACPTDTFFVTGGVGTNDVTTKPSWFESDSVNMNVQLGYVHHFGEAKDRCLEGKAVEVKTAQLGYSRLLIVSCMSFINTGANLQEIAAQFPEFQVCPKIAQDALNGFHGRIAEEAVRKYVAQREQNMRAVGVNPVQEQLVYQK